MRIILGTACAVLLWSSGAAADLQPLPPEDREPEASPSATHASAVEGDARPRDFAYGVSLQPTGDWDLHSFLIPPQVYRGVTRSGLEDMSVFNAGGAPVPFAIRSVAPEEKATPPHAPLRIFPVYGPGGSPVSGLSLRVKREADGTLVSLETTDDPAPRPDAKVRAYLLDASGVKDRATALWLRWPDGADGFVTRINVELSDDLSHWRSIANNETIAQLAHEGQRLERRRIPLGFSNGKYLRVTWRDQLPVPIVDADLELMSVVEQPDRDSTTLSPLSSKNQEPHTYRFDLGGPIPVDRVAVQGLERNTMARMELFSAASPEGPWGQRVSGLLYRLSAEGTTLDSEPFVVRPNDHRYWELRVDPRGGGLGNARPRLEVSWIPRQLVFVPRGESPFLLAYGSRRAEPSTFAASELLSSFPKDMVKELPLETIMLGMQEVLGGPEMLREPPKSPWKRWTLWGVLILGVAILAWMSVRLISQLGGPSAKTAPGDGDSAGG